ncbi:MAG TPA: rhodanese-like domain-containing protein [Gammaproteobacteria bacterium]
MPELTPTDFARRWPGEPGAGSIVLLDVREPAELEEAAIPDARHIPMREVPQRLDELPRDKPIVVFCKAGARSRRVAEFLAANGFEGVYNLEGGIDAWSRELDPNVRRY